MFPSHPDCDRCNNRGKILTQAEWSASLATAEQPKASIAEEWGDEVAKAAVDVDVLVEEFNRTTSEWAAARSRLDAAPPAKRAELTHQATAWAEEYERVGERLSTARAHYHKLMGEAGRERQAVKYNADVAAQVERIESDRIQARDRLRPEIKRAR